MKNCITIKLVPFYKPDEARQRVRRPRVSLGPVRKLPPLLVRNFPKIPPRSSEKCWLYSSRNPIKSLVLRPVMALDGPAFLPVVF